MDDGECNCKEILEKVAEHLQRALVAIDPILSCSICGNRKTLAEIRIMNGPLHCICDVCAQHCARIGEHQRAELIDVYKDKEGMLVYTHEIFAKGD